MFGDYLGLFDLETTLAAAVTIHDDGGAPVDPTVAPNFRIYDGTSCLASGLLSKLDTGVITGATNATPIVITSVAHGLQSGNKVLISNVGGNPAANGANAITRTGADTFSLPVAGNGNYTSGGTWHVEGLYQVSQTLLSSLGFEAGKSYQMIVTWNDGSTDRVKELTFGVL